MSDGMKYMGSGGFTPEMKTLDVQDAIETVLPAGSRAVTVYKKMFL